ncbi:MAG: dihydroxyacid dehydratase/phosphogluconate dehydratase [Phenylobacterium sp.]|jgi:dihydroxy-acid dehydratase|uniref:IlvD/Edd family dehydratase n=1 Tax=Phenylobacterium sp. TaxID=1871053 RepID=UPI00260E1E1F|nr:IlvD/Edd family dehydratase [Phenylobacterium sp.]MDB5498533.1 dihydroxyacid dehydratase/phosphogluconate dehydratase [Phenylobacterium sp.]
MTKRPLRSQRSYGKHDRDGFIHRSWIKATGLPDHVFDGRPIIGIANTWSELVTCQVGLRELADFVKRGVWEAGGVPIEFPAMSLPETQMRPTAMLFRNLLAMEVEESIRANPIDGVVLLGGCDKTTPGLLMGAASVDLPAIFVSSGAMLNGKFEGRDIGSGTDVWRFSEAVRAGEMSLEEFLSAESGMSRSTGVCNTMGTASTMASLTEALGISLPNNAALPAVDSRRKVLAHLSGNRIVELVNDDIKPSDIMTRAAFENAILMHAAIGGSTNAVVHLLALAGRLGVPLTLKDFDEIAREAPLLVNLMPSGKYLMEDFCYAGGAPAVAKELGPLYRRDAVTVSGKTQGEIADAAKVWNREVIGTLEAPIGPSSGVWVLKGNLCPQGAILKPSAATPGLLTHRGRAVVFETIEDYHARIDDPDLEVDETSILVLKGCGPKGYPGMPEVGNMALPRKLLQKGVTDMVRISDARMSGTAYGTVILHVAPEAEAGGPLALVRTGDEIAFDGPNRSLELLVGEVELVARRHEWEAARQPSKYMRGWYRLYIDTVLQADTGVDLDFLVGKSSADVTRESH